MEVGVIGRRSVHWLRKASTHRELQLRQRSSELTNRSGSELGIPAAVVSPSAKPAPHHGFVTAEVHEFTVGAVDGVSRARAAARSNSQVVVSVFEWNLDLFVMIDAGYDLAAPRDVERSTS